MSKRLTIIDTEYTQWVEQLDARYHQSQIKAAIKVNHELLNYYWELGRDIAELHVEERWGEGVIKNLSTDLQRRNPNSKGLSRTNIYYAKKFYLLYASYYKILPQVVGQFEEEQQPQVAGQLKEMLYSLPWGHHRILIDKCGTDPAKALFFVRQTVEQGWSRSMLLNAISTDRYERQGKALTKFKKILPDTDCDLAQELTKDPYIFAFTGLTNPYNERILKDALLNNITRFLIDLGTGFAYVGKDYRLQIGNTENFIDLLFYNLNLSCYVVIAVKMGQFEFADIGQLGGYIVACNHQLRKVGRDNPTIGLLICKEKDRIQAQYALESSSQPIGISEYELEQFYPEKVEGTIPTIEEIEAKLSENIE